MALSLFQTTIKLTPIFKPRPSSFRLLYLRPQSNRPDFPDTTDLSSDADPHTDPLLQKLEDAIHRIIVRRSAPDWLPFLPGSSYWVPPPTAQSYGLTQLIEKLAPEDPISSSTSTTVRGWPSSDYFIKGGAPHPAEVDMASNTSKSEDEEG
ncbi:Serine/arginine repetitive matrix protein 2 [Hibiscus syriacus]|uniref:Serine/arginine repetitive matrix protein 2 n=1 Tax=Hibiscus syriacus TaxID=106335 RepID=A0A6A2ZUB8_HIBSY|nr:uncharacterized protein LOC120138763 [Hibiscus syriacus]KAE8695518.1 Serine/arginine repetitive matrix protein 2 [Hibiscus syriacus]